METIQASLIRTEGTSLIFKTSPVVGILTLTGFVDDQTFVDGEDFTKVFRYTKNGVIYSDWRDII